MRTLYIDCSMGIADDLLADALLGLLPDPAALPEDLNAMGLPGVTFGVEKGCDSGFHLVVSGHAPQMMLQDAECIMQKIEAAEKVRRDALAVTAQVTEAAAQVCGDQGSQSQIYDVGNAFPMITAVCVMLAKLEPEQVLASPVRLGSGSACFACDSVSESFPMTAQILRNVPIYGGQGDTIRCTAAGAALLKHFVQRFGDMPVMTLSGYGVAHHLEKNAVLQVMLGETQEHDPEIFELSCNVDDMTGETIGFALERFLDAGALEAYTVGIGMKKSRPGVKICVLCTQQKKETMVGLMLKHTTTLGVREAGFRRYTLRREIREIQTPYGVVRRKDSSGYGITRSKYEYEDLAKIARKVDLSIDEILALVKE